MLFRLFLIFLIIFLITRLVQSFFRPLAKQKGYSNYQKQSQNRQEGDITVSDKQRGTSKKISKDEGDYIDYEEV